MSNDELTAYEQKKPLTAADIKAQVQVIQQVMAAVMVKDIHYGTIPGTPKPTLYKPGSEKILATFHIASYPKEVEDLSTQDEIRYRVKVHGISHSGILVGVGIGECSSDEEKYKWRRPVCEEEFNETPEDRRREVWKKYDGKPVKIKQVRTNPADVANTIVKMAKKRAQIDMTLTATAASDVFDQDLEDMPEELRERATNGKPPLREPQKKEAPAPVKTETGNPKIKTQIMDVSLKTGKKDGKTWGKYTITGLNQDGNEIAFGTFSETFGTLATKERGSGVYVEIEYVTGAYGNDIKNLQLVEERQPGEDG